VSSALSYHLRRELQAALDELNEGERLLRFAVECERAVFEGRVQLPDHLLRLLAAQPGAKEET
jgi:hypothetical protein